MSRTRGKALADLKRFKESFSGIFQLAEDMAAVDSIDQARDEADARLKTVLALEAKAHETHAATKKIMADEIATLEASITTAKERLATADRIADEATEEAKDAGKKELAEARAKVKAIVADGEAKVKRIVDEATAQAGAIVSEARRQAAAAGERQKEAEAEESATLARVAEAEKRLAAVNAEIEKVRARLGG